MVKKLLVFLFVLYLGYSIECLNGSGNIVPWWTIIKLPKNTVPLTTPGKSYMYLDKTKTSPSIESQQLNDLKSSALFQTLNQLNFDGTINYLLYNDEPPSLTLRGGSTYAHAKGILAFNDTDGVYIIHSTPKFPVVDKKKIALDIADNQIIYGQNFMCVKMKRDKIDEMAKLMTLNRPNVYFSRIVSSINIYIQTLINKSPSPLPYNKGTMSFTIGGFAFSYFAKTASSGLDLWLDVLSDNFKTGFKAETWGRKYQPKYCTPGYPYDVLNILEITIPSSSSYTWKDTIDHSKWGISLTGSQVCYADINRMDSQKSRGGGGICIDSPSLYAAHSAIISSSESCP